MTPRCGTWTPPRRPGSSRTSIRRSKPATLPARSRRTARTGDDQVATANLPELLVLPSLVENGGGRSIDWNNRVARKISFRAIESFLGELHLRCIGRFEDGCEPPLQDLHSRDDRNCEQV